MTIEWTDEGGAHCQWFDERNELKTGYFPLTSLKPDN